MGSASIESETHFMKRSHNVDGTEMIQYESAGVYNIEVDVATFSKLIDVDFVGNEISTIRWKPDEKRLTRSSLLSKCIGKCPEIMDHYEPRYTHPKVLN
jgi:hypothetical protein